MRAFRSMNGRWASSKYDHPVTGAKVYAREIAEEFKVDVVRFRKYYRKLGGAQAAIDKIQDLMLKDGSWSRIAPGPIATVVQVTTVEVLQEPLRTYEKQGDLKPLIGDMKTRVSDLVSYKEEVFPDRPERKDAIDSVGLPLVYRRGLARNQIKCGESGFPVNLKQCGYCSRGCFTTMGLL